jgi:hypothetical protein
VSGAHASIVAMLMKSASGRDPGFWETVQGAVDDGWQATLRLCLVLAVRYGPRGGGIGVALLILKEAAVRAHL